MILKIQGTYWKTHLKTTWHVDMDSVLYFMGVQGNFCEMFIQYSRNNYSLEQKFKPNKINTQEYLVWQ